MMKSSEIASSLTKKITKPDGTEEPEPTEEAVLYAGNEWDRSTKCEPAGDGGTDFTNNNNELCEVPE
mgnify:CR=1 FL=1